MSTLPAHSEALDADHSLREPAAAAPARDERRPIPRFIMNAKRTTRSTARRRHISREITHTVRANVRWIGEIRLIRATEAAAPRRNSRHWQGCALGTERLLPRCGVTARMTSP